MGYDDTEFLFDCRIPCLLYNVNFNLFKFKLGTFGTSVPDSTCQAGQFSAQVKVKCDYCEKEFAQEQNRTKHVAVAQKLLYVFICYFDYLTIHVIHVFKNK